MSINLDQVLQTFIDEAEELLQQMEECLLKMENQTADNETLAAVFRAAHTIKGSAGLFGLTPLVGFTHLLEDLLDRMRNSEVAIERNLIALLLSCVDHLRELLDVVAVQRRELDPDTQEREQQLCKRLASYQKTAAKHLIESSSEILTDAALATKSDHAVGSHLWHISLRFGPDVFRNGMDPASFIRYLAGFGRLVTMTTLIDSMPPAELADAESCFLGFEIDYESAADKATIARAFEFVSDDCDVHILPPHSKLDEYIQLIQRLPEGDARLGDILVSSGALTRKELESGLREQRYANEEGAVAYLGDILVDQQSVEPVLVQAALDKQAQINDKKNKESHFIRVQADKLDALINLVGELVIAGAGARLQAQQAKDAVMFEATSRVSELVEEIRDGALRLRMVPIGDTFNRFHRVVRDVSQELGKDIALHIRGADTEVDKTVVEKIGDPLMHLLRNSMDHGIESPAQRQAAGKTAKGNLTLNAYHDSGSIVIEITDDGAGLDRERIYAKAVERGLIAAGTALSDGDVYQLIFEPGFSTAKTVTNLSGRGVGMDVVRRNITALRGSVDLQSTPGQGTCVQIRLPLTLAIIDGFLVGVGQSTYVVPLDTVQECLELTDQERQIARERMHLNLRGEVLPLIFLRSHFQLPDSRIRRENVVVVRCSGQKAGLVVDELQGEFQTVIKPMGKLFGALRGISGSTILGNGTVALILDINSLVQDIIYQEGRSKGHLAVNH